MRLNAHFAEQQGAHAREFAAVKDLDRERSPCGPVCEAVVENAAGAQLIQRLLRIDRAGLTEL